MKKDCKLGFYSCCDDKKIDCLHCISKIVISLETELFHERNNRITSERTLRDRIEEERRKRVKLDRKIRKFMKNAGKI